ncbi:unnamed protein product [Discula destructiva]
MASSESPSINSPLSKGKLERLVRLSGFKFRRKRLFDSSHRDSIHHALGAINNKGRAGNQPTVTRRVTTIFRNAILTRRLYPGYDIESQDFWDAVLSDVRKEASQITQHLNVRAVVDIVSVYTQAYAEAHPEDEESGNSSEDNLSVTKSCKTPNNPKKVLLSLIRVWAKLFREHQAEKATMASAVAEAKAAAKALSSSSEPPTNPLPLQSPDESDTEYIARLQDTIKKMAAAKTASAIEIVSLKRQQVMADAHNIDRVARLHGTLDRMDVKLKEVQAELRLEKMGVGGGEDDPWVPWKDYAGTLYGAGEKPDGEGFMMAWE